MPVSFCRVFALRLLATGALLVSLSGLPAWFSPTAEAAGTATMGTRADSAVPMRVVHADLDYLYDADTAQQQRNLDALIARVQALGANTVFLQAFADPLGDGLVRSVYFPNRVLPVRATLFATVTLALRERTGAAVYAWMPVLSLDIADPGIERVTRWNLQDPHAPPAPDPAAYSRLSPFDPQARELIGQLYEDLAHAAPVDGLLFHDDAVLGELEDAGVHAREALRQAGLPDDLPQLLANPENRQAWTRLKSRWLTDLTLELAQRVRAIQGQQVKTARNLFALPIVQPESEAWFGQNLDDFLQAYDWTAPMAMPLMEGVAAENAAQWLQAIVRTVGNRPGALERTVFELQARDWSRPDSPAVSAATLADWMAALERAGARHFGYYPEDFIAGRPDAARLQPVFSPQAGAAR